MRSSWLILLLLLVSCGTVRPPATTEGAALVMMTATATGPIGTPQLLGAYWTYVRLSGGSIIKNETSRMMYRPGQVAEGLMIDERDGARFLGDVGPYAGWDVLITDPNGTYRNYAPGPFIHLELTRAATVVIAKRAGDTPAWLSDWEVTTGLEMICCSLETGRPIVSKAWKRVLPAGPHDLGVPGGGGDPYIILLEEAEPAPEVIPPTPNEACPSWVHDRYDGWHPQIDPEYWCYFEHEHGSDPAEFAAPGFTPVFNRHTVTETHEGFKGLLLRDDVGREVYITAHIATSGLGRACVRYHTLDMVFAEADGEIVGHLAFMGDFGVPWAVEAGNVSYRVEPTACPEVATLSVAGKRNIPVEMPGTGYESWQWAPPTGIPFEGKFVIVPDNPMSRCEFGERRANGNYVCDTATYSDGQDGSFRWMIFPDQTDFGFDTTDGGGGTFCTNVIGEALPCGSAGAVEQWLKPGTLFTLRDGPGKWEVREAWGAVYENFRPQLIRINRNIENQIPVSGRN